MLFDKSKFVKKKEEPSVLIKRRRLQLLVHSYLYYKMDINLIDDFTFDLWCKELIQLHKKYPKLAYKSVFPEAFENWTGFSGYDLFTNDEKAEEWAKEKAQQLLNFRGTL